MIHPQLLTYKNAYNSNIKDIAINIEKNTYEEETIDVIINDIAKINDVSEIFKKAKETLSSEINDPKLLERALKKIDKLQGRMDKYSCILSGILLEKDLNV